jgi:hypothetical protein
MKRALMALVAAVSLLVMVPGVAPAASCIQGVQGC